ncbi:MAG: hypothetical protein BJ554DRAFT_3732 [Olpidium bornovanus]|uniref:Uncharacterized protein n=1 Tax=Olpidium bornovanus TaxID=278681 RepID=A0A8H8A0H2_9FUNG|nr:MAG: hypothetical protein BJ554DRAFT_3732 [Olpidium bornovanus]
MRIQVKYPTLLSKRTPPKFVAAPLEHFYAPSVLARFSEPPYPGPVALAKHLLSRELRGISAERLVAKYGDEYPRQLFSATVLERAVLAPLREQGYITVEESRDLGHPDVSSTAGDPRPRRRGVALLYRLSEKSRPFTLDADQLNELRIQKEDCARRARARVGESGAQPAAGPRTGDQEGGLSGGDSVERKVDAYFKRVDAASTPGERTALFVKMMQGKVEVDKNIHDYRPLARGTSADGASTNDRSRRDGETAARRQC